MLQNINQLDIDQARLAVDELLANLELNRDQISAEQQFCFALIDGPSRKEELVSALVAEAFEGIPLIGGSAGDDLKFVETTVVANGHSYQNSAVLIMADSQVGFKIMKHQHFLCGQS